MKAPYVYDLRTQLLEPRRMENQDPLLTSAIVEAMRMNNRGFTINSVTGTAIAGVRTDANTFTRSAGYWIDRVYIGHGGITGTPVIGEVVAETTSTASAFLEAITDTHIILRGPFTVAEFVGDYVLTGGTSGFTVTGAGSATKTQTLTDLEGYWVWSHTSGTTTAGVWLRVTSNTAATIDVDGTLHSVGTAVMLFKNSAAAHDAVDIDVDDSEYSAMQVTEATTATVALTAASGNHQIVIADTGSNAVAVTLPDTRTLAEGAQIFIYAKDGTTNALTIVSPVAAQTLDGVDISAGGAPLATLNADDDYCLIEARNNLWTTQVDGIS